MRSRIPCPDTKNLDGKEKKMYNYVHYEMQISKRGKAMKEASFTEFRKKAAAYFNAVEQGETVRIFRHGKPIAEIVPVSSPARTLSWKRPGLKLDVGGVSLSREILREKKRSRQ
jgi:prevent-host-death family protein